MNHYLKRTSLMELAFGLIGLDSIPELKVITSLGETHLARGTAVDTKSILKLTPLKAIWKKIKLVVYKL